MLFGLNWPHARMIMQSRPPLLSLAVSVARDAHQDTASNAKVSPTASSQTAGTITVPIMTTPARRKKRRPTTPASRILLPCIDGGNSTRATSSLVTHSRRVINVFVEDMTSP